MRAVVWTEKRSVQTEIALSLPLSGRPGSGFAREAGRRSRGTRRSWSWTKTSEKQAAGDREKQVDVPDQCPTFHPLACRASRIRAPLLSLPEFHAHCLPSPLFVLSTDQLTRSDRKSPPFPEGLTVSCVSNLRRMRASAAVDSGSCVLLRREIRSDRTISDYHGQVLLNGELATGETWSRLVRAESTGRAKNGERPVLSVVQCFAS